MNEYEVEDVHSLDAWRRATKLSQERAVENRARAVRRRLHRRAYSLAGFVAVLLATGTVLLIIATR